jgi:hypothetical protein
MKDAAGHIIGFERLNVTLPPHAAGLTLEVVSTTGDTRPT